MKYFRGVKLPKGMISAWYDEVTDDLGAITDDQAKDAEVSAFFRKVRKEIDSTTCKRDEYWWDGYEAGMDEAIDRVKEWYELDLPNKAIFNYPASVLFWPDGTKTVSKCLDGDSWDPEKGVMAAMLRKYLGYGWFERVAALIPDSARHEELRVDHTVSEGVDTVCACVATSRGDSAYLYDKTDEIADDLKRHKEGLIEVADLLRKLADE